jgi:hypothetical protein
VRAVVLYDEDGTNTKIIEGFKITTQLVKRGRGVALIRVRNENNELVKAYHYSKVYSIEVTYDRS